MAKKYVIKNYREYGDQADVQKDLKNLVAFGEDDMQISDGYHTMDELYDHRVTLFITLMRMMQEHFDILTGDDEEAQRDRPVWRSKRHSDGEICFGTGTQFILGIYAEKGSQITYHIPIERWDETDFADTMETAPEFDGHTSDDVVDRLKKLTEL